MNQFLWDGRPMPDAPFIHGSRCVHIDRATGEICGKFVALDRSQGWLCDEHESVIARYNALKQLE